MFFQILVKVKRMILLLMLSERNGIVDCFKYYNQGPVSSLIFNFVFLDFLNSWIIL